MCVHMADDVRGPALQYEDLIRADRARKRPLARGVVIVTLDGLGITVLDHERVRRPTVLKDVCNSRDLRGSRGGEPGWRMRMTRLV